MTEKNKSYSKPSKILLAMNLGKNYALHQNWYSPLKENCKTLLTFNVTQTSLFYGQKAMNNRLITTVKKEKPDYLFLYLIHDEISIDTLLNIKKISSQTKIVNLFGDDDTEFYGFSRYFALFCDYLIIAQEEFVKHYNKEGITNLFLIPLIANTDHFKPLNLKKIYDVSFIGTQKQNRADQVRYLKNKGVRVRVYGRGWDKCPELRDIYFGIPDNQEVVRIINQTKINLSFTEGRNSIAHIKGKVPETLSCNSFLLSQYCSEYLRFFKEGEELVFFKNKEDLFKKINYFLKNKKEREEIAKRGYKKMATKYGLNIYLKNFFKTAQKQEEKGDILPKIDKNLFVYLKGM